MTDRAKLKRGKRRLANPGSTRPSSSREARRPFAIVGIGASAGGLEALTQFLSNARADGDMAFVVIQHLDPTLKGMMPELLQRATTMKVVQVKDSSTVQPGIVYVIPPNKDMSILHGRLHLLDPVAPRGLRLPIDYFFRSLAEDQHELGIGVILSGMGSDGTLGLKAIKEYAGLVLVQEPASAKFDGMPRSAIDAGLADFVAPAEELPGKLVDYMRHMPRIGRSEVPLEEKTISALDKVIILLRSKTGHDFTLYRRSTLYRRVERRMGIHQIIQIATYVRFLQENPQELDILFKELLIGVTSFFRDPAAWDRLEKKALPALLAARPSDCVLRAWIAGCSTGEEAYSLAIVFKETLRRLKSRRDISLQIYATDIDRDAIDKARQGVYPKNIVAEVSPARLRRFFVKEENGFRVSKDIRSMVVFAPQNMIMDPPFTKLDIFCCRNLLIYLTPELQKKLVPLFHYVLNPGGLLFLGSSESIGSFSTLFTPVAAKERIFRRCESIQQDDQADFPAVFTAPKRGRSEAAAEAQRPAASLQTLADQVLRSRYIPPAVLVNVKGDIIYISGHTGKYLEPAAGKANWNIVAMAREGLRHDLTSALQKVNRTKEPVGIRGIRVGTGPERQTVDIFVQALQEPKELLGMVLIVFSDAPPEVESGPKERKGKASILSTRRAQLELELRHARDEVKTNREEMQSSQEELKSMNEELQSTNEELQSTNEELTTSKEEMQSLNEELQTVNAELQSKLEELSSSNNDMKNLLNSTDIATVFLDNGMRVRRFTIQAKSIFKLIPGDVGRPITDLSSNLLYPELAADAREVLRTLAISEKSVRTSDGRWFTTRIMPYRTLDNKIDGVVITFANITAAKKLEANLREKHKMLEKSSARRTSRLGAVSRSPVKDS
jgi:chemotaxis methyl-accepting protein methylase